VQEAVAELRGKVDEKHYKCKSVVSCGDDSVFSVLEQQFVFFFNVIVLDTEINNLPQDSILICLPRYSIENWLKTI
jgi:hypothetical protein